MAWVAGPTAPGAFVERDGRRGADDVARSFGVFHARHACLARKAGLSMRVRKEDVDSGEKVSDGELDGVERPRGLSCETFPRWATSGCFLKLEYRTL